MIGTAPGHVTVNVLLYICLSKTKKSFIESMRCAAKNIKHHKQQRQHSFGPVKVNADIYWSVALLLFICYSFVTCIKSRHRTTRSSPRVTKKQKRLSTMVSMMASMSVSRMSALLMAAQERQIRHKREETRRDGNLVTSHSISLILVN